MSDSAIDRQVLDELRETTGAEFTTELVNTFLDEAPGMIASLKQAAAAVDADGFRRAAHSIKSNANIFGATGLASLSRQMELMDIGRTEPDFTTLDAEFARAATALRDALDG